MNIKNQPPIFVPPQFQRELDDSLIKAALLDIAWDYAVRCSGAAEDDHEAVMRELRMTAQIILKHRRDGR